MARRPRLDLPGYLQHVIIRGNNRQVIFVAEDDYLFYLELLSEAASKYRCSIHAWVLMTNHIHLLMTSTEVGAIGKVIQSVGRRYVQYFNYCYKRTGTLWEGRYKSTIVDTERYALTCYRYIEMNPIRAGMHVYSEDYRWSSYQYNAMGLDDNIVTPHPAYLSLADDAPARRIRYRELFTEAVDQKLTDQIRFSTNKGWILGNAKFKDEVGELLNTRVEPLKRGGDRRSYNFREKRKI